MKLEDMLSAPAADDYNGVVFAEKGGEGDLSEYIFTRSVAENLSLILNRIISGIASETENTGIWISGDFGSGKSHFLKTLSLMLDGRGLSERNFTETGAGSEILEAAKRIEDLNIEPILFNIDMQAVKGGENRSLTAAFLNVFNKNCGYCENNPAVAEFERYLAGIGKYEDFKREFKSVSGSDWSSRRGEPGFAADYIIKATAALGVMSSGAIESVCANMNSDYRTSIDEFAGVVREHTDKTGAAVVFLADEIGQFIGGDTALMLELQTIVEALSSSCRGRAWIVVTSQHEMNIKDQNALDFSKIRGRFALKVSLKSLETEEIVVKRFLEKNRSGVGSLSRMYSRYRLKFSDTIYSDSDVVFEDKARFISLYPFAPYQFKLLPEVLDNIRKRGEAGADISTAERSILSVFHSALTYMKTFEKNGRAIAPLYAFYGGLREFFSPDETEVVEDADKYLKNERIGGAQKRLAVDILKTLLILKYSNSVRATEGNLLKLLISDLKQDADKATTELRTALAALLKTNTIKKRGDAFAFLSTGEIETENKISKIDVENREIVRSIADVLFGKIFTLKKIALPNGAEVGLGRFIDGAPYKQIRGGCDVGVNFITGLGEISYGDGDLKLLSGECRQTIVLLDGSADSDRPNIMESFDEIRRAIQIEKYIESVGARNLDDRFVKIKTEEKTALMSRAEIYLKNAADNALVYSLGEKVFGVTIKRAAERLAAEVYHKNALINEHIGYDDIMKELTYGAKPNSVKYKQNAAALDDMEEYIGLSGKISVDEVKRRFLKPPYGYPQSDTVWLILTLLKDNRIGLILNGVNTDIFKLCEPEEIFGIIADNKRQDKPELFGFNDTNIDKENVLTKLRGLYLELSDADTAPDDSFIASSLFTELDKLRTELDKYSVYYIAEDNICADNMFKYPGREIIASGRELIGEVCPASDRRELETGKNVVAAKADEIAGFYRKFERVREFFKSDQYKIYSMAAGLCGRIRNIIQFMPDEKAKKLYASIAEILSDGEPYKRIPELRESYLELSDIYYNILNALKADAKNKLDKLTGGALYESVALKEIAKRIPDSDNADEILGVMYMIDAADTEGGSKSKIKEY